MRKYANSPISKIVIVRNSPKTLDKRLGNVWSRNRKKAWSNSIWS